MKMTECLATEHQVFLDQLEVIERAVKDAALYPDAAIKAMVEMLALPLERHARTEEVLFRALEAYLERTTGPLAVMESEHQGIRQTLEAISDDLDVRGQTSRLTEMLRRHINKEDRVLFPMAEEFLGAETLSRLVDDGCGRHEPTARKR